MDAFSLATSSSIFALLLAVEAQPRPAPPPLAPAPYPAPRPPRALSLRCELALPPLPGRRPPGAAPARVRADTAGRLERYFCWGDEPIGLRGVGGRRIGLRLAVGPEGRVRNCLVTASSGLAELDRAACRILVERAELTPATDARGRPTWDSIDRSILWPYPPPVYMPAPPPPPVPPAPPGTYRPAERARSRMPLNHYFSGDDYPASALRAEEQGTTRFQLTIGPDGRVQHCTVTASSGSVALDAATCRIMRSRARYLPARDTEGRPTTGTDRGYITWRIPADDRIMPDPRIDLAFQRLPRGAAPPRPLAAIERMFNQADYPDEVWALEAAPEPTVLAFTIGADGRVVGCRTSRPSGIAALDAMACRTLAARAAFAPARDRRGRAIAVRTELRIAWGAPREAPPPPIPITVTPAPPAPPPPPR